MHQLKKIEMTGFKSFAKKSTLYFNSPVVGVVGPNGSGKSNVVEAFRFVLGEQSIKSLRSKSGADLIFKGSKSLPALSRASVSITFDNSKKQFSFSGSDLEKVSLDFDEIVITREVFRDGGNTYLINGTEVRLKDVIDLLASVHIGSSGHHIISQGAADRILTSNGKERKVMIEDALGLKVYQTKIREAEKKLEKTRLNMKEVAIQRRELAPHLTFLKKQVEKIEQASIIRADLENLFGSYQKSELLFIKNKKDELHNFEKEQKETLESIDKQISSLEKVMKERFSSAPDPRIEEHEKSLASFRHAKSDIEHSIGRLEGMIQVLENQGKHVGDNKPISRNTVVSFAKDTISTIDEALSSGDSTVLKNALSHIKSKLQNLVTIEEDIVIDNSALIQEHRYIITKLNQERNQIISREQSIESAIVSIKQEKSEHESNFAESEKNYLSLVRQKSDIESELRFSTHKHEDIKSREERLEQEIRELSVLIGPSAVLLKDEAELILTEEALSTLKQKIFRLKIKLEDSGSIGGNEITVEYQNALERDQFLMQELSDLDGALLNTTTLIAELRSTLMTEFKQGVEKINTQFQEFFSTMFGGGNAFLSILTLDKKENSEDEEVISDVDKADPIMEQGIEIHVSLPHKKVKDLQMLSGGERSLTSIALLFAISQVNPPPFLVLDETDAALDEANSRRYGDMIERLSKYSELIVVTHNRETMSRAKVLYGVTVGMDGSSKLLSVQFDEAEQYAK